MFIPNTKCDLHRRSTSRDNFGRFNYHPKVKAPCAVIFLDVTIQKSSVRADTSGSRGQAEQFQGDAMLLFPKNLAITEGDVTFIDNRWLEVIEVEPRRNVLGKLDHLQVVLRKVEPINGA